MTKSLKLDLTAFKSLLLTAACMLALAWFALLAGAPGARANLIVDAGFEASPAGTVFDAGPPFTSTGTWGIVRVATGGVTPHGGSQMIELDAGEGEVSTDFYQLIDVSGLGGQAAVFSAYFNSTAAKDMLISLRAWTGALPVDFGGEIAGSVEFFPGPLFSDVFTTDADAAKWEQVSGTYIIPVTASFVAIGLHSPTGGPTAFADDVFFDIQQVPEPATLALFALGLAGLGALRRNRRCFN